MMSHQMSNVSFRVGDFNSFQVSDHHHQRIQKNNFKAKKSEFCEIVKIQKRKNELR